jgi:hypothetical protein
MRLTITIAALTAGLASAQTQCQFDLANQFGATHWKRVGRIVSGWLGIRKVSTLTTHPFIGGSYGTGWTGLGA